MPSERVVHRSVCPKKRRRVCLERGEVQVMWTM